jgi:hypothetical protein
MSMFMDSHALETSGVTTARTCSMMGFQVIRSLRHHAYLKTQQAYLCDFARALSLIPPSASSSCVHVDMEALHQHLCGKSVSGYVQCNARDASVTICRRPPAQRL